MISGLTLLRTSLHGMIVPVWDRLVLANQNCAQNSDFLNLSSSDEHSSLVS